jgi:4-diphosphocytidyl-2-C-methyl-D-erythritol kinase
MLNTSRTAGLAVASFAKINLGLRVLGRRLDGYHEIRTTLQSIDLADEIGMEPDASISLEVTGPYTVPADETNLVQRAARAFAARFPGHGARITLHKTIPAGAGLGGGSSNAAATLLGLERLWGLDVDPGVRYAIARDLGMDVPFFLYGGTCLGVGRGDEVLPLRDISPWSVVVVWPGVSLSTAEVYSELPLALTRPRILSSMKGFVPASSERAAGELGDSSDASDADERRPEVDGAEKRPPDVVNDLEETAFLKVPSLRRLKDRLMASGAAAAAMSGSGSAVFGLFSSQQVADRTAVSLSNVETAAFACRTLSRDAYHLKLFKRSRT